MIVEHVFDDKPSLYQALNTHIARDLQAELAESDQAMLLVSGGSSPAPVYRLLSSEQLRWSHIDVALVDERWVDAGQQGSNQTLIEHNLLQNHAVDAIFTGMKTPHETALEGQASCEQSYEKLPWQHAVALLGMGPDGHTASLFPEAEGLDEGLHSDNYCVAIQAKPSDVTGDLTERMSLTLAAIAGCKHLYLLITGDEKRAVFERAKQQAGNLPPEALVIAHVLALNTVDVKVFWAP